MTPEEYNQIERSMASYGFGLRGILPVPEAEMMGIEKLAVTILKDEDPEPRLIERLPGLLGEVAEDGCLNYQEFYTMSVAAGVQNKAGWVLDVLYNLLQKHCEPVPDGLPDMLKKLEDARKDKEETIGKTLDSPSGRQFAAERRDGIAEKWHILSPTLLEHFEEQFLLYNRKDELRDRRNAAIKEYYRTKTLGC
jgi:hypothetical protein